MWYCLVTRCPLRLHPGMGFLLIRAVEVTGVQNEVAGTIRGRPPRPIDETRRRWAGLLFRADQIALDGEVTLLGGTEVCGQGTGQPGSAAHR